MKRNLLLSGAFVLTFAFIADAQEMPVLKSVALDNKIPAIEQLPVAEDASSYDLGYSVSDLSGAAAIGVGSSCTIEAAICLPSELLTKFVGGRITAVKFAAGSGISNISVFARNALTSASKQSTAACTDFNASAWNTVELSTAYEIDGSDIYVGYASSLDASYSIYFDGVTTNDNGALLAVNNGSWSSYSTSGWGSLTILAQVEGADLKMYDVVVSNVKSSSALYKKDSEATFTFDVANFGTEDITSLSYTYTITGSEPVSATISTSLPSMNTTTLTLENVKMLKKGTAGLEVTVTSVNDGKADEQTSDNTAAKSIYVYVDGLARNVLMENFTGLACGNCPYFHNAMDDALEARTDAERVIWVAHHAGYLNDSFTTAESKAYTWFFNAGGSTFAPAVMFDRTQLEGETAPTFFMTPTVAVANEYLDKVLSVPAFASLSIEASCLDSKLTLKVGGEVTDEFEDYRQAAEQNDLRLTIFLLENGKRANQSGAGMMTHNHIHRDNVTATWGDAVVLSQGKFAPMEYTFDLSSAWVPENMDIVAFLSNLDENDATNSVVYNSIKIAMPENVTAIAGVAAEKVAVAVNGKTLNINGEYERAVVYSLAGVAVRSVSGDSASDLSDLPCGVYFVEVSTLNGGKAVAKVAVK